MSITASDTATAPALTPRETAVLAWADRARRTRITLQDVADAVGADSAPKTASSMARKGLLDRVGRGVYLVRPLRAVASPWGTSALASVAALLEGQRYYVGGPAALALHRLTTQAYGSVVDVFVTGHRRPRELGGARLVFHVVPSHAFDFGLVAMPVEGHPLTISDPERTVLDLLERPRLLGPTQTFAAVKEAASRLNVQRLVGYALRWPTMSTCQRLGVLLERAGTPADALVLLGRRIQGVGVAAMLRAAPRRGPVHPVWRIVENDIGNVSRPGATENRGTRVQQGRSQ